MAAELRNSGAGPLKLSESNHTIARVSPLLATEDPGNLERDLGLIGSRPGLVDWPELLAGPENSIDIVLRPGEVYQELHDFLIQPSARVVEVRSSYGNMSLSGSDERRNWKKNMKTIFDAGATVCR